MNKSKKGLILASGIIALVECFFMFILGLVFCLNASVIVDSLRFEVTADIAVLTNMIIAMGIVMFLLAIVNLVGGILLLCSVSSDKIEQRKGMFITGAVFTIIGSGAVGVSAILLYIAFALSDDPKPEVVPAPSVQPQPKVEDGNEKIKNKLEILREMKQKGEITEQEFHDMVLDLLKK